MKPTLFKIVTASGYILTLDYKALSALLLENNLKSTSQLPKIGYKLELN